MIESGGHKIFHQPPGQPASSSELLQAVRSVTKDAGSFAVLSTRNANEAYHRELSSSRPFRSRGLS